MVSGTQDNPPPEATLSSVYIQIRGSWRPSQNQPCMIIHNPYWIIKCENIRISALNPKSRHYVTLVTPGAVPRRRAKAFIWRKVVPHARVTLPAEVRKLTHPSCVAPPPPRRVRVPNVNAWRNFGKKQAKRYLGQGNSGEGCLEPLWIWVKNFSAYLT